MKNDLSTACAEMFIEEALCAVAGPGGNQVTPPPPKKNVIYDIAWYKMNIDV